MLNEDIVKYRLESLKMAYDISFKIGSMKKEQTVDDTQIRDYLQDVFSLADMNFHYIVDGIHPDMNLHDIDFPDEVGE